MSQRILFISLPSHLQSDQLPLAYLSLASYVNDRTSHEALIYNPKESCCNKYLSQLIDYLHDLRPDIIGIACYTPDYNYVLHLAKKIVKEIACKIVVGNVHATLFPHDFIYEGSPIDFAIIGEGEITLGRLLDVLDKGGNISDVNGLAYLQNKKCVRTIPREFCDLSSMPLLDYDLIDIKPYLLSVGLIRHIAIRGVSIYTSRGCPFKCKFCAANTVWNSNTGPKVRFRSIDSIIRELSFLKEKYSIFGFYLMDDTFMLRRDRVLEFCRRVKQLGMVWAAQSRVHEIDKELVKTMKSAGCIQLEFGVESGSEKILKRINKNIKIADIIRSADICHTCNVRMLVNIMYNHPEETMEDIAETLSLLRRIRPDACMVHELTPYPGTAIFTEYGFDKIISKDNYFLLTSRRAFDQRFKLAKYDLESDCVGFMIAHSGRAKKLVPSTIRVFFSHYRYLKAVVNSGYFLQIVRIALKGFHIYHRHFIFTVANIIFPPSLYCTFIRSKIGKRFVRKRREKLIKEIEREKSICIGDNK